MNKTPSFVVLSFLALTGFAGSLEDVKANFVRVLRHTNPEIQAEVMKLDCSVDTGDANIKSVLETMGVDPAHIANLVRTQREDGTWPDVDYSTVTRSRWPIRAHLEHLVDLARAKRTPETEAAFHKALSYWIKGDFTIPHGVRPKNAACGWTVRVQSN